VTGPNLERFVLAQEDREIFGQALAELHAGRKRSHWMWFVFPQIAGLGQSADAASSSSASTSPFQEIRF
jgi:uncharacterized protein (DUF1810 family)